MIDLSSDFRESVVGRSGQRRYIDAAANAAMSDWFFTWKLDGGVMVLDSQRPEIGSPISDKARFDGTQWIFHRATSKISNGSVYKNQTGTLWIGKYAWYVLGSVCAGV
jgi:hypothetical protein